jgi:hypothetical protein
MSYQGIPGDSLTRTDIPRLEIPVVENNESSQETAPVDGSNQLPRQKALANLKLVSSSVGSSATSAHASSKYNS